MQNKKITLLKSTLLGCTLLSNVAAHEFKSGFYMGPQIGVSRQHVKFKTDFRVNTVTPSVTKEQTKNKTNFLYGGVLGYRHMMRNCFIMGVNLDFDFDNKKIKSTLNYPEIGVGVFINQELKKRFSLSPTIQLGRVINSKFMVFAQVGAVINKYKLKTDCPFGETSHKKNKTLAGFTAGLGTEYAMNSKWSLKGTVNYEMMKKFKAHFTQVISSGATLDRQDTRIKNSGVNFKLAAIYKI